MRRSWDVLLLPLLTSLYPPLFAAGGIDGALVRMGDLAWPVLATVAVGIAGWGLGYLVTMRTEKAALISVVVILSFSWLGWVVGDSSGAAGWGMLGVGSLACGSFIVAVAASRRALDQVVAYLLRVTVILVAWNVFAIVWRTTHPDRKPGPRIKADISASGILRHPQPDIYVIVLDKYSRSDMLAERFKLDNRPFERQLQARGFIVPKNARANYIHTFLSLGAMLNLRYLDFLNTKYGADTRWEVEYPVVENNRLAAFLRAQGYRYIFFPTEFGGTRQNRYADLQIPLPREVVPEVTSAWLSGTVLAVATNLRCWTNCLNVTPPYTTASTTLMDWRFRMVATLPDSGGHPLFVFAHFLVPHPPYIYDADCHHELGFWPRSDRQIQDTVRKAYAAQVRCVNSKVLEMVDSITARSRVPPVILLQADHGHGFFERDIPVLAEADTADVQDRTSVFAAYLLPGVPADSVPSDISPVNVTRLVLRHYFGADLPPLQERSYWSSSRNPYIFESIR